MKKKALTENERVVLYDATLREGDQAEDINFSKEDKLRILTKLDEFGMDYIEGGYPGANPKDAAFFKEAVKVPLKKSKLVAFGMTRRADKKAGQDLGLKAILKTGVRATTLFGKSWDLHVKEALRITYDENLRVIHDSVSYMKMRMEEVFFDAEHFFSGYLANPKYALKCIKAAEDAGADSIILCDTNGGMLPGQIEQIVGDVLSHMQVPLGIHVHNDSDLAVANSLAAVKKGARQIQGTINGYGERCGNANLCSIIPNLHFKIDSLQTSLPDIEKLRECSRFVAELANQMPSRHQPYVGDSAFAHKGGIHVSAVTKNPVTYEHIFPESVGNQRRILISDVSGKTSIEQKAMEYRLNLKGKKGASGKIVNMLKNMEKQGYRYEGAEASFELLMKKTLGEAPRFFNLMGFRVLDEKKQETEPPYSEATVMIEVNGEIEHTAAEGEGPVNALDNALRKALAKFYPQLNTVRLLDYKVRVLPSGDGTASSVRVLIESGDGKKKWSTVGVSFNIIEASWQALVDSVDYKLYSDL